VGCCVLCKRQVWFGCLRLDKSCFVAPRVDWVRILLEAAALLVDAFVAVHDEVTACIGAGLSGKRSFICRALCEFPFSFRVLFPSPFEEAGPLRVVCAHFFQITDLHFVEQRIIVSGGGAVEVSWSFEAVWAGEVH